MTRVRPKWEIVGEIEEARRELPLAWNMVRARNPITIAARAGKATAGRWRVKAREKSQVMDYKIRATPLKYLAIALALGTTAGLVVRWILSRRQNAQTRV